MRAGASIIARRRYVSLSDDQSARVCLRCALCLRFLSRFFGAGGRVEGKREWGIDESVGGLFLGGWV